MKRLLIALPVVLGALLATAIIQGQLLIRPGGLSLQAVTQDVNVLSVNGTTVSLGQAAMVASFPVVIASNQSAIPVTGTFFQATQPVSLAASVTVLGTLTHNNAAPGATNIGTLVALANTASPTYTEGDQVLLSTDLQGNLRVNATQGVAQNSVTSGQVGTLVQGAVTTAAPTYTTARTSPLSLDTAGNLRVVVQGGSTNAAASATGSAVPSAASYNGVNIGGTLRGQTGVNPSGVVYAAATDLTSVGGSTVATAASGIQKVGLTDGTGTALTSTLVSGKQGLDANIINGGATSTESATYATGALGVAETISFTQIYGVGGGTTWGRLTAGQTTMNSSVPVVVASNQSAIPVTASAGTNLNTSLLALDSSVNGMLLTQASPTSGQKGPLVMGAATTGPVTYVNGQTVPLSIALDGGLRVEVLNGATGGTSLADGATLTRGSTQVTPIAGLASTNDAAYGTAVNGKAAVWQMSLAGHGLVDIGNGSATDTNNYALAAAAATTTSTAAASECPIVSAASTNSTNCKNTAGNLYGYELYNTTTTVYYLRLYNTAAAPTCSSATGFLRSIPIPPAASAGLVGGAVDNYTVPVNSALGVSFCLTGGAASTDNTNAAVGVFGAIRLK